jgi:hypothetical protein
VHSKDLTVSMMVLGTSTSMPSIDRGWICVPVMGMSTFIREWTALHSMHNHNLIPLAPYLLKASPVVSATHLRFFPTASLRLYPNLFFTAR